MDVQLLIKVINVYGIIINVEILIVKIYMVLHIQYVINNGIYVQLDKMEDVQECKIVNL